MHVNKCKHLIAWYAYMQDNGVEFQMDNQDNEKCLVMEQKETPDGLKDEPCDRDVQDRQAGLCK